MISIRTKPRYFTAHQWSGQTERVNDDIEIHRLEHLVDPFGNNVGVVITNQQPVCQIVANIWIICDVNGKICQLVDQHTFEHTFQQFEVVDAEFTDLVILLPYTPDV